MPSIFYKYSPFILISLHFFLQISGTQSGDRSNFQGHVLTAFKMEKQGNFV